FSDPGPVFHTIVSIKNDGHYFCRAGGNRPDGLNEPVTSVMLIRAKLISMSGRIWEFIPISIEVNLLRTWGTLAPFFVLPIFVFMYNS
ncbi:hypothetical protein, partial [Escherichia coli]|uniref:hypothetical protein n=1 Tax=Escherichia coli TaxID=562 RepID=UPI0025959024